MNPAILAVGGPGLVAAALSDHLHQLSEARKLGAKVRKQLTSKGGSWAEFAKDWNLFKNSLGWFQFSKDKSPEWKQAFEEGWHAPTRPVIKRGGGVYDSAP